jgi:dihydroxyacetone kinase
VHEDHHDESTEIATHALDSIVEMHRQEEETERTEAITEALSDVAEAAQETREHEADAAADIAESINVNGHDDGGAPASEMVPVEEEETQEEAEELEPPQSADHDTIGEHEHPRERRREDRHTYGFRRR